MLLRLLTQYSIPEPQHVRRVGASWQFRDLRAPLFLALCGQCLEEPVIQCWSDMASQEELQIHLTALRSSPGRPSQKAFLTRHGLSYMRDFSRIICLLVG